VCDKGGCGDLRSLGGSFPVRVIYLDSRSTGLLIFLLTKEA